MNALVIALIVVAIVILSPFLLIWSLNALFPALAIAYTFQTWVDVNVINLYISLTLKGSK